VVACQQFVIILENLLHIISAISKLKLHICFIYYLYCHTFSLVNKDSCTWYNCDTIRWCHNLLLSDTSWYATREWKWCGWHINHIKSLHKYVAACGDGEDKQCGEQERDQWVLNVGLMGTCHLQTGSHQRKELMACIADWHAGNKF
jgi:hypothetical protein